VASPCGWIFFAFLAENFATIKIKAVHNLKAKSLGLSLTPWAMFLTISAFLLFLVSEVSCAHFWCFWPILAFVCNSVTIKKLFPKM